MLIRRISLPPTLRKVREGRGTHISGSAGEIKSVGHPPLLFLYPVTDQFPVTVGRPKPVDESNSFGSESKFGVNLGNPN